MNELPLAIPDAQVLLSLEPEELAGKVLFVLRRRIENSRQPEHFFILANLLNELWPTNYMPNYQPPYRLNCKSKSISRSVNRGDG
jgi:hypothetical protein